MPSYMYLFRRNQVLQQWSTPLSAIKQMWHAWAKPDSFVRGIQTLADFFLVAVGREKPNTAKSGPSSASQMGGSMMAQHWMLAVYSFVIFQGDPDQYCIEPYIFVIFQERGSDSPCADTGILPGGGVQARLSENSSEVFFSFFLILNFTEYITVLQRVSNGYFKEDYTFPWFQRESNIFQGGGGGGSNGVQMLISIETHITCHFRGGSPDPYPPSWPAHAPCPPLDPRMNYREKTPI